MWKCFNRLELIATRGVPGSGKSTWAKAWVAGAPRRARVNRDDIRYQLFGSYFGPEVDEGAVSQVQQAMILSLLGAQFSVIVDNTHINVNRDLRPLANLAKKYEARFSVVQIDVPLEVALERNAARDRVVPEDVIRNMYERMHQNPLPDEWRF